MYKGKRVGIVIPAFNEVPKIFNVAEKIRKVDFLDEIVFVDDCSDDGTYEFLSKNFKTIRHERRMGVGASIRDGFSYLIDKVDIIVIMAGNDKDDPSEIPLLLEPIFSGCDFVQGSRFLGRFGNTPLLRIIGTKWIHPFVFWVTTGKKLTDTANGFRAIRTSIIKELWDSLNQKWLDKYGLEIYLLYRALERYKVCEVGVSKIYPDHKLGYTKIRVRDWLSLVTPPILLKLKLRK